MTFRNRHQCYKCKREAWYKKTLGIYVCDDCLYDEIIEDQFRYEEEEKEEENENRNND